MNNSKAIWVTWERQRRSVVLSKEFNAEYHELISKKKGLIRYVVLLRKTLALLRREKPPLIYIQNPSMVLAFVASIYKRLSPDTILVVDRHSNFFPLTNSAILNGIHDLLSNYTIRKADVTVVTNNYLKNLIENIGGSACVLEDKVPDLQKKRDISLKGKVNILFVCSFDPDEPYNKVFEAARLIDPNIHIYVTGNYKKIQNKKILDNIPENIVLLGYVKEQEYIDYLHAVDVVMVLTEWDYTLLCGAYEAVAAEKPLVLSNKRDLLAYFKRGVVKTENKSTDIAEAIITAVYKKNELKAEIRALKIEMNKDWQGKFNKLNETIGIRQEKIRSI